MFTVKVTSLQYLNTATPWARVPPTHRPVTLCRTEARPPDTPTRLAPGSSQAVRKLWKLGQIQLLVFETVPSPI